MQRQASTFEKIGRPVIINEDLVLTFRKTLRERRDPIVLPTSESIELIIAASSRRFGALIRAAELTGCRQDEYTIVRSQEGVKDGTDNEASIE